MAWNKALPSGSTPVNASDNGIRDNWSYLRDAIRQEHADPDANPSAPSAIVHTQGSGRIIVYTGATVLDSSADVVAQVSALYHDTTDIGRVVIDQNTSATPGGIWYCVDTDTFVEIGRLWGALAIGGALTVGGTAGITGLLTASGGITIPTTKQLIVPPGEASIDDGTNDMDPFAHAARHAGSGADPVTGIVKSNVIYKTDAGPETTAGTLVSHTFDFSSRSGNSLILALAWGTAFFEDVAIGNTHTLTAAIQLDGGTPADVSQEMTLSASAFGGNEDYHVPLVAPCAFLIPNSAGQDVNWELKTIGKTGGAGSPSVIDFGMILIDLGPVGLTT